MFILVRTSGKGKLAIVFDFKETLDLVCAFIPFLTDNTEFEL